ncbi:MAG: electron transfer flavoprotein subunit alpha/FixB family protein [Actinomycetia bacterium]|nr:electron transfer flavoprotein subunit alpha/FixB family protein [Actinomycetes bacterium]
MSDEVLVIAEHAGAKLTDSTFELVGKAKELASQMGGQTVVGLIGAPDLAPQLGGSDLVVTIDGPGLDHYTAEGWEKSLAPLITARAPKVVLMATTTQGLDLAGALSATCGCPLASYVVDVALDGDAVVATAQIYGGKIMAEVALEGSTVICGVTAGSFPVEAGKGEGTPAVEVGPSPDLADPKSAFVGMNEPEAGDVDITAADILVAVGRGVGSEDDVEMAQDLADAIGAPLAASRPVTDAGWLPKSRQVGKSGVKVKPRAYLMFGISGAPEHLEGMRDAELIIACNTDEKAPIFDVAHYGSTLDLFDLLPALSEQLDQ